jgi:uncharacterized protein (TIGR02246 family)
MRAESIRLAVLSLAIALMLTSALTSHPARADDLDTLAARVQVLEDREAIRALIMAYGQAHDHRDYRRFASLFAADGEWIGGLGSARGPEAIFALMDERIGHDPQPAGSGTFHVMTNDQIEIDGDRASATTKWIYLTPGEDGSPRPTYLGHYDDEFIRENGEWKFLRRQSISDISPLAANSANETRQEREARLRATLPDTPGTGPFPAMKTTDPRLPEQVVYRPRDLESLGDTRLGVYAFGNGGCTDDAAHTRLHLLEIASHGYLAIAPGRVYSGPGALARPEQPPGEDVPTRAGQLAEAIDWALAENERQGSPYYGRIDPDAVAVSGFSCGGLQALMNADDPRVATAVIMNSGLFVDGPTRMAGMEVTKSLLDELHFPTLYILGGPTDIAYENGMDDFERIDHVPVAVANIDKGHGGTYWEPNGGPAAAVALDWLNWQLRGDRQAARTFTGARCGLCTDPEWTYESKGIE